MRVRNSCLIDTKQLFTIFFIAIIFVAILYLMIKLLPPSNYMVIAILTLFGMWWLGITLYFFSCFIYPLGYNIVNETGITRRFLYFKKHYNWNELQFISKTRTYGKYNIPMQKIIVSVEIPKEAFKRRHTYRLYSKKCFYMPYSKELEDYIIAKAPIDSYTYTYFIDDTNKYNI